MPLTLLQIVQRVQAELGLPQTPGGIVIGSSDPTTIQMLALANRCLDELRRMPEGGWTALQFEYDLVVTVPVTTTGDTGPNSPIITNIPSTAGIVANFWTCAGSSIPSAARVQSVDSATQVTLNMEVADADAQVGTALTFSQDTYPIPSDFDWIQNETMWDRTNHWQLLGPASPQRDQALLSGIVAVGPRRVWRQIGPYANGFRLWPPPNEISSPLQLVFEYMSLNAVSVAGSLTTFGQYFTADTDKPLLDDQAIIQGIKWMFWEIKGFGSYVTLQNRWVDYVNRLIARDGGSKTLSLARRPISNLLTSGNVQDGNFPGPTGTNTD